MDQGDGGDAKPWLTNSGGNGRNTTFVHYRTKERNGEYQNQYEQYHTDTNELVAYWSFDEDSGLSLLAHAICCLLFKLEIELEEKDKEERSREFIKQQHSKSDNFIGWI